MGSSEYPGHGVLCVPRYSARVTQRHSLGLPSPPVSPTARPSQKWSHAHAAPAIYRPSQDHATCCNAMQRARRLPLMAPLCAMPSAHAYRLQLAEYSTTNQVPLAPPRRAHAHAHTHVHAHTHAHAHAHTPARTHTRTRDGLPRRCPSRGRGVLVSTLMLPWSTSCSRLCRASGSGGTAAPTHCRLRPCLSWR